MIREYPNRHYKLIDNIDLSDFTNWEPIGTLKNPFTGTLDGNHCKITNLSINKNAGYVGLFGVIAGGAKISNLSLIDFDVHARPPAAAGSLIGLMLAGAEVKNIYANGTIRAGKINDGNFLGGLVGEMRGGSLTDSSIVGEFAVSSSHSGGLIGRYGGGIVKRNSVNVTFDITDGPAYRGAIFGSAPTLTIGPNFAIDEYPLSDIVYHGNSNAPISFGYIRCRMYIVIDDAYIKDIDPSFSNSSGSSMDYSRCANMLRLSQGTYTNWHTTFD